MLPTEIFFDIIYESIFFIQDFDQREMSPVRKKMKIENDDISKLSDDVNEMSGNISMVHFD